MTDLTIVTNNPQFLNAKLQKATELIFSIDANIKSRQFDIASVLARVDVEKLYTDDGFSSAIEYASTTFGIGKSLAYELITIGKEYTRNVCNAKGNIVGHASNLVPPANPDKQDAPLIDFTTGQIGKCLSLGREKILELIEKGELTPRLTIKQIVGLVKANKPPKEVTTTQEQTEQPTQEQTEQTEQPTQEQTEQTEQPTQEQPTQEQPPIYIETVRGTGFDNLPSDVLIAELRLRGFKVFSREGKEMLYTWNIN